MVFLKDFLAKLKDKVCIIFNDLNCTDNNNLQYMTKYQIKESTI